MWLWWVLGGLGAWFVVALLLGVVLGRGIRIAEQREIEDLNVPAAVAVTGRPVTDRPLARPRLRIPLPPVGVGLSALALALETCGFVLRQTGHETPVLSMDAPHSLPRMYVAALFAAAAVAASAGAGALPGRRTWWTAVGVVAGSIAAVKATGTLHARALYALGELTGKSAATVISAGVVLVVLVALWSLSRGERRDRRRILLCLAGYALAAVGLSAVSAAAGPNWTVVATFGEESGEALAGVAFLVAVLVGVAPRLVLPADWALRRRADAHTLDAGEIAGGREAALGR